MNNYTQRKFKEIIRKWCAYGWMWDLWAK